MNRMSDIAQRRALAREVGDPDYVQRRVDVLEAAARVFKRKGFRAASVSDIAREVGIDRASLYYYASGKDELFREIVLGATRENVEMAERIRGGKDGPLAKMAAFVSGLVRSYEVHYPYLHVYVQEDMAQIGNDKSAWSREMRNLARRFDEAVIAMVQEGIDSRVFRSESNDARLVAYGIIGMCNWTHRWFRPGGKDSADQIATCFVAMVLHGLAAGNIPAIDQHER